MQLNKLIPWVPLHHTVRQGQVSPYAFYQPNLHQMINFNKLINNPGAHLNIMFSPYFVAKS